MRKIACVLWVWCFMTGAGFAAQLVDLNSADQQALESINGIGPAKASAIIEYRNKNGGFKNLEELDNVPGFGPKGVEKLRSLVTVGATPGRAGADAAPSAVRPPLYGFVRGDLGLRRDDEQSSEFKSAD